MQFIKLTKNYMRIFLFILFIAVSKIYISAETNPFGLDIPIKSDALYLINLDTNTLIYEKNKDLQINCSALAKIMTTILILESDECKKNPQKFLNKKITASRDIFERLYLKSASNANLRQGETITVKDALYATMLQSACEATMMLVEMMVGKNTEKFVSMMNEKAKNLKMTQTYFTDPDGLDETQQQTTAFDMYLLTRYCLKNDIFKKIATTPTYDIPPTNIHDNPTQLIHTNKMLNKYLGGKNYDSRVKGIKTAKVSDKYNLVSIASANSYNYLLVTLGAPNNKDYNIFSETKRIYDWVFSNLKIKIIANPGEKLIPNNLKVNFSKNSQGINLTPKNPVAILLPNYVDASTIFWDTSSINHELNAPIKKGAIIGDITLKLSDQPLHTVTVVAADDVKVDILSLISHYVVKIITAWQTIVILTLTIILIFYLFLNKKFNIKKNKKNKFKKYKPFK